MLDSIRRCDDSKAQEPNSLSVSTIRALGLIAVSAFYKIECCNLRCLAARLSRSVTLHMNVKKIFVTSSVTVVVAVLLLAWFFSPYFLLLFLLFGPIIAIGTVDMLPKRQTVRRNFLVIGILLSLLVKFPLEIM